MKKLSDEFTFRYTKRGVGERKSAKEGSLERKGTQNERPEVGKA